MSTHSTSRIRPAILVQPPVVPETGTIRVDSVDGVDVYVLENDALSASIIPDRGARIASLVDQATGYEWMWRPSAKMVLPASDLGTPFEQGPLVGADECVPTVGPCVIDGVEYPDHGEAWSSAWDVEVDSGRGEIITTVNLRRTPISVRRSVCLSGAVLSLRYEFRNRSARDLPWLWSWHPLMNIPRRPRLTLVGFENFLRPEGGVGVPLDSEWAWPRPFAGADLGELNLGGHGRAVKLFAKRSEAPGIVRIEDEESGSALSIDLDGPHLSALGLWISRGGWNGAEHFAIEPATLAYESPADAPMADPCTVLPAGGSISFEMPISIGR